jgi:hypothetical protein
MMCRSAHCASCMIVHCCCAVTAGAVQILVDLLGPPPATVIAWEQQEYKHILQPPPPPPPAAAAPSQAHHVAIALPGSGQQGKTEQQQTSQQDPHCQRTASGKRVTGSSITGSSTRTLGVGNPASGILRNTMTPRRTGTGALEEAGSLGSKAARSMKPSKWVLPKTLPSSSLRPVGWISDCASASLLCRNNQARIALNEHSCCRYAAYSFQLYC